MLPGKIFLHYNANNRSVEPATLITLPIDWLKIDKKYSGGFDSEKSFVSEFITDSLIALDTYYTYLNLNFINSIVETVYILKTFASNATIPRVDDSNSINSDLNIVAQHDGQDSCFDRIPFLQIDQ